MKKILKISTERPCGTLEQAEDACQKHHEENILEAIERE